MRLSVTDVSRTTIELPYREVPERTMPGHGWNYFQIVSVEVNGDHVGYGETTLNYGVPEVKAGDAEVERARGANPVDLLWDDSLGWDLQTALFDAVGRALDVPVHDLLGDKIHDRTPLSWWARDMGAEDWLAECRAAIDAGYTNMKLKGRPWRDVRGIVETLSEELPEWFELDIDFNDTLLDADRAIPILRELESYPQVNTFETPIPQDDIAGNREIREAVESELALHYGSAPYEDDPLEMLSEGICDGFVLGDLRPVVGGLVRDGAVTAMAGTPFWLQLVGGELTTAMGLHLGGVLEQATWPAITCFQLFDESILTAPIAVEEGYADVPDAPGLGVDVDPDAIERFRVDDPDFEPTPHLFETTWSDGTTMYFADGAEMMRMGRAGEMPCYERGVTTRLTYDDGSDAWRERYERARDGPLVETEA